MSPRRRASWSVLSTTAGLVRLGLIVLAVPAVMIGLLVGAMIALAVGILSVTGFIARQPTVPWRVVIGHLHALFARARTRGMAM